MTPRATISLLAAAGLALGFSQCASDSSSLSEPEAFASKPANAAQAARTVAIPKELNDHEKHCLPMILSTLKEAGFRTSLDASAPYQLDFHVTGNLLGAEAEASFAAPTAPEASAGGRKQLSIPVANGPLRAKASITLRKGERTVASATEAFEGPRSSYTAERVAENAVDRCLRQFSEHLTVANELGAADRSGL